jgi:hypothetical protein
VAGTAEFGMPRVHFVTGRDAPHTRLPAVAATPSCSTADQSPRRRYRQHFCVRDPLQSERVSGKRLLGITKPSVMHGRPSWASGCQVCGAARCNGRRIGLRPHQLLSPSLLRHPRIQTKYLHLHHLDAKNTGHAGTGTPHHWSPSVSATWIGCFESPTRMKTAEKRAPTDFCGARPIVAKLLRFRVSQRVRPHSASQTGTGDPAAPRHTRSPRRETSWWPPTGPVVGLSEKPAVSNTEHHCRESRGKPLSPVSRFLRFGGRTRAASTPDIRWSGQKLSSARAFPDNFSSNQRQHVEETASG